MQEIDHKTEQKTFVLDTSVLTFSPYAFLAFDEHRVIIPVAVIEELNNKAQFGGEEGANARTALRALERTCGYHGSGLCRGHERYETQDGGTVEIIDELYCRKSNIAMGDMEKRFWWNKNEAVFRVIKTAALFTKTSDPLSENSYFGDKDAKPTNVVHLVTKNLTQRLIARDIAGISAEDLRSAQIEDGRKQYTGRCTVYVTNDELNSFAQKGFLELGAGERYYLPEGVGTDSITDYNLTINEFCILRSNSNSMLGRYDGKKIVKLKYDNTMPMDIKPRNVGQRFALEALLAPASEAPLVILKGPAGTAKTFLAMAAGLQQTYNTQNPTYKRILCSRPAVKFDDEIGFLSGDENSKIGPLMRPIFDNIENLMPNAEKNKGATDEFNPKNPGYIESNSPARYLMDKGVVVTQAMAFMRGRSVCDTFIFIDECQNSSPNQVLGLITRPGEGSKIVLVGDPEQIDNPEYDKRSNGLSVASEKMKGSPFCWQVTFNEHECTRSALAQDAIMRMSDKGADRFFGK